jgi:heme oxygenase
MPIQPASASTQTESLRAALRTTTHVEHVRLNRHGLLAGLTRPDYPLSSYHLVLLAYHRFYAAVEAAIEAVPAAMNAGFDYQARRKRGWLDADLAYFQLDPQTAPNTLPEALLGLRLNSPGSLIGTLYVIEGSTLGGQVIARHLAEHLGLTATTGARFFTAYGPLIEQRWHEFLAWAETVQPADEIRRDACIQAQAMFHLLEDLLDAHLLPAR